MSEIVLIDEAQEVSCYYFSITCSNDHNLLISADPKWIITAIGFIQFKCLTCDETVTIGGGQEVACAEDHKHAAVCSECE